MLTFYLIMIAVVVCQLAIGLFFLRRSYVTCDTDQAIIKTGYGGHQVLSGRGIIVLPIVQRYQRISLVAQPIEINFDPARPLRFEDGQSESLQITAWLSPTMDVDKFELIAGVQTMGASGISDPEYLSRFYSDSLRQAISKPASNARRDDWFDSLPEIPVDLYHAIANELETFHQVHRISVAKDQRDN